MYHFLFLNIVFNLQFKRTNVNIFFRVKRLVVPFHTLAVYCSVNILNGTLICVNILMKRNVRNIYSLFLYHLISQANQFRGCD